MSSTDITNAVNDLKKLSAWFQGILKVGPVLEKFVSLEQSVEEAQSRVTQKQQEHATLVANIDLARGTLQDASLRATEAKALAATREEEAKWSGQAHLDEKAKEARANADNIVGNAKKHAEQIVADAQKNATATLNAVNATVAEKKKELLQLTQYVTDSTALHKTVQDALAAARAKLG